MPIALSLILAFVALFLACMGLTALILGLFPKVRPIVVVPTVIMGFITSVTLTSILVGLSIPV